MPQKPHNLIREGFAVPAKILGWWGQTILPWVGTITRIIVPTPGSLVWSHDECDMDLAHNGTIYIQNQIKRILTNAVHKCNVRIGLCAYAHNLRSWSTLQTYSISRHFSPNEGDWQSRSALVWECAQMQNRMELSPTLLVVPRKQEREHAHKSKPAPSLLLRLTASLLLRLLQRWLELKYVTQYSHHRRSLQRSRIPWGHLRLKSVEGSKKIRASWVCSLKVTGMCWYKKI